jgi:hypothetical protein
VGSSRTEHMYVGIVAAMAIVRIYISILYIVASYSSYTSSIYVLYTYLYVHIYIVRNTKSSTIVRTRSSILLEEVLI